ncbi:hypothetical protein BH23ACT2_BH23ACT2_01340 [soil metagenome]
MCLSAEASLLSGVAIGAVGIDALRHVRYRHEALIAALPAVFGFHQLVEGLVWLSSEGEAPARLAQPAARLYLLIALVVIPLLVPLAVIALEPRAGRYRRAVFAAVGVGVAAVCLQALLSSSVTVGTGQHYVTYGVGLSHGGLVVALYVLATCGPALWSTRPHIRLFGFVNLVAVGLLGRLSLSGLISLWCAWAAVTSVAIAAHLRAARRTESGPPVHRPAAASQPSSRSSA